MDQLLTFTAGAITLGFLIAALFFLRFWRSTGDGLFAAFAAAFLMLSVGQAMLTFMDIREEEKSWLYLIRLAAFLCILLAAVRKNRTAR
jgi:hypothetical protein